MCTITFRLSGLEGPVDTMLDALRGLPGVDRVQEMGVADVPRQRDDSSSAGLSAAAAGSGTRDVEIHATSQAAMQHVRTRAEVVARDAGVVVEWLEPF
jgi:hypothetical protein